jgi:hypothetical protein
MDVNRIWRFELVRGYSPNPREGACLLTAVSWLVHGKHSDQPPCVCPVLAQFGRITNDIFETEDRQRLKGFIYRLAGSRDAAAIQDRVL